MPVPAAVQRHQDDRQRALAQLAWLLPTLVAGCLGLIRVGWPALWADKLATWGMVTVPWRQAWPVLQHTDATLGAYYAVMHVWVSVLGDSDVMLRLPSVLAIGGRRRADGSDGTRLATPRVGLLSGLVFAVLPAASRYSPGGAPVRARGVRRGAVHASRWCTCWTAHGAGRWPATRWRSPCSDCCT